MKMNGGEKMYQCFHCLENSVIWNADFDFSDYGIEGEGVVHVCHCSNCGAYIEYYCPCVNTEGEVAENGQRA